MKATILILTALLLSSCGHQSTCIIKPGVEPNPQGKTIDEMITPKGEVRCDF